MSEPIRLLTARQAMALLSVRRTTLQKLLRKRELTKVKILGATRIPESSVVAYIEKNTIQPMRVSKLDGLR
jgi:excisionase family DNA binding protein